MPKFEDHCNTSQELFGESGEEYHKWIDQYATYGYRHRQVLHNKEGVEVGVQLFGECARKHLERHIRDDYEKDDIPSIKDLRGYPANLDGLKEHKSKYVIDNSQLKDELYEGAPLNIRYYEQHIPLNYNYHYYNNKTV